MADDDIEALLREVEASTGRAAASSQPPQATPPAERGPAEVDRARGASRVGGALVAGAVAAGGTWLAITFLSGLRWLAVVVAFVVAVVAWLVKP